MRSVLKWFRLPLCLVTAFSLMGQITPYWIYLNTFYCDPSYLPYGTYACRWSATGKSGSVVADAGATCNAVTKRTGMNVYAGAQATLLNCSNYYQIIADGYATPGYEPIYYAVSAGGYQSGCGPNLYVQDACDYGYSTVIGGCVKDPC